MDSKAQGLLRKPALARLFSRFSRGRDRQPASSFPIPSALHCLQMPVLSVFSHLWDVFGEMKSSSPSDCEACPRNNARACH